MPNTGVKFPGTGTNVDFDGNRAWSGPGNITADDASDASVYAPVTNDPTDWLRASNFTYGIPAGSTIDGMEGTVIDVRVNDVTAFWNACTIFSQLGLAAGDSQHLDFTSISATPQTETAGGSADLWGLTPTLANLESSNWGFGIRNTTTNSDDTLLIDAMSMTIYYTSESVAALMIGDGCTETQLIAGGRTVTLNLTGLTWAVAGATFDAERQGIIDGISGSAIPVQAAGWNAKVRDTMGVAQCVRTSNTQVTITLLAAEVADYQIVVDESLGATIPASAHSGAGILTDLGFATITAECDQTLAPDTIVTQTNLSGAVTDIDEPVDSPDANWLLVA